MLEEPEPAGNDEKAAGDEKSVGDVQESKDQRCHGDGSGFAHTKLVAEREQQQV